MKKIRKSVFETNSSSTHSICIAKDLTPELPKSIHFEFGEFGWECDTLYSMTEKASYLYTGLIANQRKDDFNKIVDLLINRGVEVTTEEENESDYWKNGYVDHSDQLSTFLNSVCSDENKLLSFLFSDLSFIITGNDNDETDVDINVTYSHDGFYKGN